MGNDVGAILRRIFRREYEVAREWSRRRKELNIRHAWERAALAAWQIEVLHLIEHGDD